MSTNNPIIQKYLLEREARLLACKGVEDALAEYFLGKPRHAEKQATDKKPKKRRHKRHGK